MRKIFFTFAMLLMSITMHAQTTDIKAQSIYDVNQDDKVAVSDVTSVVNRLKAPEGSSTEKTVVDTEKLLEVLNALYAKIDKLENSQKLIKQTLGLDPDEEYVDHDAINLLPGIFSVSDTKQVQFAKSNLYWDGSEFHFEANQTDFPTEWSTTHVGHFYWTNLTDYQSGNASYMPYAETLSASSQSTSDKFWCGEDSPLTVEGTTGLYALTGDFGGEWYYLINDRTNANSLYKYGVTVTNDGKDYENCLIIAPDDFTGTLESSYTLDEVNTAGLVCLPAAGRREGSSLYVVGPFGSYWSATPCSSDSENALRLFYYSSYIDPASGYDFRDKGRCLRLVRTVE